MNLQTKSKPVVDPFDSTRDTIQKVREQLEANTLEFQAWLPVVSPTYTWDWKHQLYLYAQLNRITSGEINRLQIAMPPRHTKKLFDCILFFENLEANPFWV